MGSAIALNFSVDFDAVIHHFRIRLTGEQAHITDMFCCPLQHVPKIIFGGVIELVADVDFQREIRCFLVVFHVCSLFEKRPTWAPCGFYVWLSYRGLCSALCRK